MGSLLSNILDLKSVVLISFKSGNKKLQKILIVSILKLIEKNNYVKILRNFQQNDALPYVIL